MGSQVRSVALQDLAKVPPGLSSLLCQLSLIAVLHLSTAFVHCFQALHTEYFLLFCSLCNFVL